MTTDHPPEGNQPPPYFFLSYARSKYQPDDGSDPDLWVKKLYKALCYDVHHLTASPNPGFMDLQTPLGSQWPAMLSGALSQCRVFVALLSPGYFTSEYCGKEWAVFTERMRAHSGGGEPPIALIPALWTPFRLDELPPEVSEIQLIPPGFPRTYGEEGFFGLMKLRRYNQAYKESVLLMAKTIKRIAEETNLRTCTPPDLAEVENAFAVHQAKSVARRVQVTVAAYSLPASRAEGADRSLQSRSPYYYGHTMREWTPYRSRTDSTPIARYAEQVIAGLGHQAVIAPLDEPEVEAAPAPSIMVVDPWAAGVPAIGDRLRRLDDPPRHVIVPWNNDDEDTTRDEDRLERDLTATVGRSLALNGSARRVPTLKAFREQLPKAVNEAITRHFKTAPAYPPQEPPVERPLHEQTPDSPRRDQ
ncbi:TIR-like protein FxsC [Actinomadura sp. DC4]|uniref:TIR-like protein FxsC n=1 Tax=Actinomadura sp. DC4 TaxID=3055069 RepID=UPI0025AED4FD|nr:TIR-like protein FxsC [Actinomadura sp. DC4]MDN3359125.1 TIR-like protein FxsC [Actinomadura sp. DC4]